jgi:hypothetical protein
MEETRYKKRLFPTKTKQNTSCESNLIGTTEERLVFTKKLPAKNDENYFPSYTFTFTLPNPRKKVTGCFARNSVSATTKYAVAQKARGNSYVV